MDARPVDQRLLLVAGFVLLAWGLAGCETPGPRLTPAAFSPIDPGPNPTADTLPIIDAHGHLNYDMSGETLVSLMDRAGVRRMVLMARYYRGDGRSS